MTKQVEINSAVQLFRETMVEIPVTIVCDFFQTLN